MLEPQQQLVLMRPVPSSCTCCRRELTEQASRLPQYPCRATAAAFTAGGVLPFMPLFTLLVKIRLESKAAVETRGEAACRLGASILWGASPQCGFFWLQVVCSLPQGGWWPLPSPAAGRAARPYCLRGARAQVQVLVAGKKCQCYCTARSGCTAKSGCPHNCQPVSSSRLATSRGAMHLMVNHVYMAVWAGRPTPLESVPCPQFNCTPLIKRPLLHPSPHVSSMTRQLITRVVFNCSS